MEFQKIKTNGITLNAAIDGPEDGKPVILLHGYPEFWASWRYQIPALAAQGFRVIAPDQRGYNLSDKPRGIAAYRLDVLAADIVGLADTLGYNTFSLAGHDWGAGVAWWLAASHPDRLERLAILNVPHGAVFQRFLRKNPGQLLKSWYFFFFQIPGVIEAIVRMTGGRALFNAMQRSALDGTFSEEDFLRYRDAWLRPGAITGMVNWYRAIVQQPPKSGGHGQISVPTLVIWGEKDAFLKAEMAQPSVRMCKDGRLATFPDATHWVQHEKPDEVNALLADFLK